MLGDEMYHKYQKSLGIDRIRIPVQEKEVLEMHRNARIDFYDDKIDKKLKEYLSFQKLNRYPDVDRLYDRLAKFHDIDRNNLLITSGIDGGIKTVFEMCTEEGSRIMVLTPTYGMYYAYSQAYQTEMLSIESDSRTLSISIDRLISNMNDDIDILFLPNPHEPIENVFDIEQLELVISKAQEHDILVFMDEAYYMFGAPTAISLIDKYKNLIVARTFSKGLGLPSIRLGYLIANPDLIRYLESKRFAHETNSLTIDIAVWAMDNIEIFDKYIAEVCSSRDWLITELNHRGFATHGNKSNTILINLSEEDSANYMADQLKEMDIIVRGYLPSPVSSYILVTMGSRKMVEKFLEAFLSIDNKKETNGYR